MSLCKCIVPLQHEGTLNNRQAPILLRLVEVEEKLEAPDPSGYFPQIRGGTELNRTLTCMVLKDMTNDISTSSPLS
ncbi:hypothetical protein TNCV_3558481 [Trichonephila clavipes]|uniref:Uncharacterized protein n=1 Tax=Trichonephila clavipes TaxID=2585209 RepID=A0A8X7BIC2_TRICX|nr:hypothetical protein TNCV_3558481 [Trichonephila clavipes]